MPGLGGASASQEYYRTAPLQVGIFYNDTPAPHAVTARATYTVPAGKYANVEAITLRVDRNAVATTAALAASRAIYTPSGGSAQDITRAITYSNTVGGGEQVVISPWGMMNPGDTIALYTEDASTTGTLRFILSAKIAEYNR